MIPAVYDCNVLVQAFAGRGAARQAWQLAAAGMVTPWVSPAVWAEYEAKIPGTVARIRPEADTAEVMALLLRTVRFRDAPPLGRHLLRLKKPFGIAMVTPAEFIHLVRG